ncbi:zinc-binding dehydrogenase [Actinomadura sp. DC4]|uniref:zinc-binding dehydrogenase n=1 Tax=Actinomadura sp. DC4 TaxID=3055069 RepID=UPI0025B15CE5|nr:zinc-binding dehydrogenase [Actinomadura sp. DC4]MDN3355797.1 zinc-binding dehydrogenase [Actinomadura sp. DC4]
MIITVLAAAVPAYTRALIGGERGTIPTPLVLGAACVGRVEAVADEVFNVAPGDIVVDIALLGSGDTAEPQEILVGWTGVGGRGRATRTTEGMQALWHDGVFAERALCPKECLVRLPGAGRYPRPDKLAFLPWLGIAAEGLNRAGLQAGHVVVVVGATGQLGGAAVLGALARGAARVVAVGRNAGALDRLAGLDRRVVPVALTGDREQDAKAITAASGGADRVLDALGDVPSAGPTLAGYDSLRPGGTMVVIGGVRQDLPLPYGDLMRRRLTVAGSWMCSPATALTVWNMVAAGTLDLGPLGVRTVGLDDPAGALDLAANTSGPEFVALVPG